MTSRRDMEKRGFLRTQGWKRIRDKDWLDLHPGFEWGKDWWICTLDGAYTRAMKSKAARESRRLKAAGWEWKDCGPRADQPAGWHGPSQGFMQRSFTRAEALASLTQEGGAK